MKCVRLRVDSVLIDLAEFRTARRISYRLCGFRLPKKQQGLRLRARAIGRSKKKQASDNGKRKAGSFGYVQGRLFAAALGEQLCSDPALAAMRYLKLGSFKMKIRTLFGSAGSLQLRQEE